jgi:DNA-binding CsgD family transcriptional regulator
LTAAREACDDVAVYVVTTALPEFVEAAERAGEHEIAVSAEHRFAERADACDTDWALGMRARCRALVTKERDAEALYREAIGRLNLCRAAPHLARAHLLYGEWLRRRRRRRDARQELRTAHQMLSSMGIRAFAERARIELTAAGEKQERSETDAPMTELLTPQESQIAQLVSHGASNPEVAAQLFISRRTVEFHLSKVYMKLGVSSRTQLARLFIEEQS